MNVYDSLRYLCLKVILIILRPLASLALGKYTNLKYDEGLQLPSRDTNRTIKTHIHRHSSVSSNPNKPCPVLINFHGSGFVLDMHGSDDEFCRQMADQTPDLVVLDIQYRLGPECPFPAAPNDAQDAVNWVLSQPDKFDKTRIAISGFSAGGNLALVMAGVIFPKDTFKALMAFYPPTDLVTPPSEKKAPDTSGKPLPDLLANLFNACYLPRGVDVRDPRISPSLAKTDGFSSSVLMITAACDNLAPEAESLADKMKKQSGISVVQKRMAGCDHAWDKHAESGHLKDAKVEAYALASKMLSAI